MTDSDLELIHAEIDGELDSRQRSELARRLLAEPEVRAVRDQLHRLCGRLETLEQVEPPAELQTRILTALPPTAMLTRARKSMPRWRYAALFAGVLGAGALVFETVRGPGPATSEMTGTMAAGAPVTLDTVSLSEGPVAGRVSLYREGTGLAVALELTATAPVDVLVATEGHTLRINGLAAESGAAGSQVVALPGGMKGQPVELTFLMSGRQVGSARLTVP
jgi:hypothetical protein